jgi:hypothetical protein
MPIIGRFLPRLGPPAPARGPPFLRPGWACRRSSREGRRAWIRGITGVPRASGRKAVGNAASGGGRGGLAPVAGALSSAAHPFEFRYLVRVIEVMGLRQRVGRGGAFGRPQGAEKKTEREEERGYRDGYKDEVHSIPSLHRNHRPKSYASHGPLGYRASCRTTARMALTATRLPVPLPL